MSNIWEYIKMAIQNILSNKGRSLLTMLGIIIGIASVIMIMAIGAGTTNSMNSEIDSVAGGQIAIMCSGDAIDADEYITPADLEAIKSKIAGVEAAEPSIWSEGEAVTGKGDFVLNMSGVSADNLLISNLDLKRGRYINESDVQEGRRVCVISDSDAKRLFGSDDVVGMEIEVASSDVSKNFQIIGVTTQKENSAFVSYSYEGMPVMMDTPYSALADYNEDYDKFYNVYVLADKERDSQEISDNVVKLLEARHKSAGEEYFQVQSFQDVMQSMNMMMGVVTAFVSCVAGISLLVGGIGVMNIMLVSVSERTREIGIRKSLGAKTSSIMLQFLAESAFLTIVGGVIGIILGILGAFGVCALISNGLGSVITPGIQLSTVLGATLFSTAVGVFFGIYPARKAANLSPIEALRRN